MRPRLSRFSLSPPPRCADDHARRRHGHRAARLRRAGAARRRGGGARRLRGPVRLGRGGGVRPRRAALGFGCGLHGAEMGGRGLSRLRLALRLLLWPREGLARRRRRRAARARISARVSHQCAEPEGRRVLRDLPAAFIPAGATVAAFSLLLAGVHAVLALIWFSALIALTVPLGRWLRRPAGRAAMDRLTGAVFLAFGASWRWRGLSG